MKTTSHKIRNFKLSRVSISVLILLLCCSSGITSQGQYLRNSRFQNTIYFETLGATGLGPSINYKRSVFLNQNTCVNFNGGIGCILYSFNGDADLVIPLSLTLAHGSVNSFEWGFGMSIITGEKIYAPNLMLGYRLQKGSFYFWAGGVILMFFEDVSYIEGEKSKWEYGLTIPVPGIRIGKSF